MTGGASTQSQFDDGDIDLNANLPHGPRRKADTIILPRPTKDMRPTTWDSIPLALRGIAKEVQAIQDSGGDVIVWPKEGRDIGRHSMWGANGPDSFEVTADDLRVIADIIEHYLQKTENDKEWGPPKNYPDLPAIDLFGVGDFKLMPDPIFVEYKVDLNTGEEYFAINQESLAEDLRRWEERFRTGNQRKNIRRMEHYGEPLNEGPGRVLTMFDTICEAVSEDGETKQLPISMPTVRIEPKKF